MRTRGRRVLVALLVLSWVGAGAACSSFSSTDAAMVDGGQPEAMASDARVDVDGTAEPDATPEAAPHVTAVGCSDGTLEGFDSGDDIAACEGAWGQPGIHPGDLPSCSRHAGNDGDAGFALGCGAADLCAAGWHVCTGATDVMVHTSVPGRGPCADPHTPDGSTFFATAQPSTGNGICDPGGSSVNDLFGCGDFMATADGTCAPLNVILTSDSHPSQFSLGGSNSTTEREVVKKGPGPGGVLCCKDGP